MKALHMRLHELRIRWQVISVAVWRGRLNHWKLIGAVSHLSEIRLRTVRHARHVCTMKVAWLGPMSRKCSWTVRKHVSWSMVVPSIGRACRGGEVTVLVKLVKTTTRAVA